MVVANLIAAIFFGVAGTATFLAGRLWFPIIWWVLGLFWLRRYFWARDSPFLELSTEDLRIYISPGREQILPWSHVEAVHSQEKRIDLELADGSKAGFRASDLAAGEFLRFSTKVKQLAARS